MMLIFISRQTGSGKTYTMEGMDDEDDKRGIISRTSSKIFQETSSLVEKVKAYSFFDIYLKMLYYIHISSKGSMMTKKLLSFLGLEV